MPDFNAALAAPVLASAVAADDRVILGDVSANGWVVLRADALLNALFLVGTGGHMTYDETDGFNAYRANDEGTCIGLSAGLNDAADGINIGFFAGGGAATGGQVVRIGRHAGFDSAGAQAVLVGHAAGQYAYNTATAVMIGYEAGRNPSQNASFVSFQSVAIGYLAGQAATAIQTGVLVGKSAGQFAADAIGAVLIGWEAGKGTAAQLRYAVHIGNEAGAASVDAQRTVFIGTSAGKTLSRHMSMVIEGYESYGASGTGGLIYGEFDTRLLVVNGDLTVTGPAPDGTPAGNANPKIRCAGALTAGGNVGSFYETATSGPRIYSGSGAPTLSAAVKGSLYLRTDGSGTVNRMYVATDTAGGWAAIITAS